MKAKLFVTFAILFAVSMLFTTISYGGGAKNRTSAAAIEAQLGIKISERLPDTVKAGQSFQGTVLSPEKLAQHGFKNLKRGDSVTIKAVNEQGKFNIMSGGQNKNFLLGEKGNIGLTQ